MTARREPEPRIITDATVERLRQMGAGDDLVAFADHHVTRYSEADLDRTARRWFLAGIACTVMIVVVISWLA